jgi:mRNA interferase RelE/StbE
MSYELHFHPLALKEWKKLAKDLQEGPTLRPLR